MQKAFVVVLALSMALTGGGIGASAMAQSAGPQSAPKDDRANTNKAQSATTSGPEEGKARTANRSSSEHSFTKGVRFSRSKAANYRRVNYRESKRLTAPPAGQVWVRAGSDAVLVRLSDNIVVKVISGVF